MYNPERSTQHTEANEYSRAPGQPEFRWRLEGEYEKKSRRREKIMRTFATFALLAVADKVSAEYVWGSDEVVAKQVAVGESDPTQPTTNVYIFPGTAMRDPTARTRNLVDATFKKIPNSHTYSIVEGQRPNLLKTYDVIDETFEAGGVPDRIIMYGMSVGGKEALGAAAHIRQENPDVDMTIVLSSTPFDASSVPQFQDDIGSLVPFVAEKATKHGIAGGPILRTGMELVERSSEYITEDGFSPSKLKDTYESVRESRLTKDSASNELLFWQLHQVIDPSAPRYLQGLANTDTEEAQTEVYYFNTLYDEFVDNDSAVSDFRYHAKENDLDFREVQLAVRHSSEYGNPDTYIRATQSIISRLDFENPQEESQKSALQDRISQDYSSND